MKRDASSPSIGARALTAGVLASALCLAACGSEPTREDAAATKGDVFVVVIDTLRRDSLRTFAPDSPLGEAFDALARDSIVFDDLRSGTSWTRPAVASLLTGQHSKRHGIHGRRDVLPATGPHVVERLRDAGYATHAWSANPNVLPLWGFGRGFDTFVDLGENLPQEPGRTRVPKVEGRMAFERVLEAVDRADGPGFYYVHVVDPHPPYRPSKEDLAAIDAMGDAIRDTFPVEIGSPFTRVAWERSYRRYMGEVLDVDRALGELVAGLKARDRYDDATILVVSDHGEEFLEHGGEGHGFTLFEEVLRVPGLLKRADGAGAGTRYEGPVELVDMMPTLLASIGLTPPPEIDGRNLLEVHPDADRARYADLFLDRSRLAAVYEGGHKLIVDYLTDRAELFDLERDPEERRDLSRKDPERTTRMKALLVSARARHAAGWHLRGCGCRDRTDELSFDLEWAPERKEAAATTLDVESSDTLTTTPGGARVRWVLEPDRGRAVSEETRRADRDELVLAASDDADARVVPSGDGGLAVAFGAGPIAVVSEPLDLAGRRPEAAISASEPVDCLALVRAYASKDPGAGDLCEPHLRIWYVAEPESHEGELDPDVRDRLRALGYAE